MNFWFLMISPSLVGFYPNNCNTMEDKLEKAQEHTDNWPQLNNQPNDRKTPDNSATFIRTHTPTYSSVLLFTQIFDKINTIVVLFPQSMA